MRRYHPDHKRVGQLLFDTAYGAGSVAANRHTFDDAHSVHSHYHGNH
jgi:hypothetical protein